MRYGSNDEERGGFKAGQLVVLASSPPLYWSSCPGGWDMLCNTVSTCPVSLGLCMY